MLFNSHVFILAFLPIVLAGFFLLTRVSSTRPARLWLLAASFVFYGWWSWSYLGLLLLSVLFNWTIGELIRSARESDPRSARVIAAFAVAVDLAILGYFKYATFIVGNVAALSGLELALDGVVLPLAISFYTFQQIAYIVDVLRRRARRYALSDYMLFVSFFPQLIAGPIVHHHEMLPQFERRETYRFHDEAVAAGVAFFVLGLVKKLAIADPVTTLATPIFAHAAGDPPGAIEAWLAVTAFSVGIYFDFSAYSDMAVGLARMFGIQLPYNFNSPYQATSIIDFWRRWHITLSRFLRDYVYIPLGGNRHGPTRRHVNLILTMLLGGLWHGAAWTFVVWGGLHGLYLLVNHGWNGYAARAEAKSGRRPTLGAPLGRVLTLLAVIIAWVFFAAPSFAAAAAMLAGLFGANGLAHPETLALITAPLGANLSGLMGELEADPVLRTAVRGSLALSALAVGLAVIFAAPNSQQIVDGRSARMDEPRRWCRLRFRPTPAAALATAGGFLFAVALMSNVKEFVYFQF